MNILPKTPGLSAQTRQAPALQKEKPPKQNNNGRSMGWGLRALKRLIGLFMRRPDIVGLENVDPHRPAIFVANHLGAIGPLLMCTFFPLPFVPWVAHETTDSTLSAEHIRKWFVERDLKVKPPFSRIIAAPLGVASVALMKRLGVIPVYSRTRRLRETVELSIAALRRGDGLLVFPEISDWGDPSAFTDVNRGFVNIARAFWRRTGTCPVFYPIAIDPIRNRVCVGPGKAYDPTGPMVGEKRRIAGYLHRSIRANISSSR